MEAIKSFRNAWSISICGEVSSNSYAITNLKVLAASKIAISPLHRGRQDVVMKFVLVLFSPLCTPQLFGSQERKVPCNSLREDSEEESSGGLKKFSKSSNNIFIHCSLSSVSHILRGSFNKCSGKWGAMSLRYALRWNTWNYSRSKQQTCRHQGDLLARTSNSQNTRITYKFR